MTSMIRLAKKSDAAAVKDIYAPYVLNTAISFEAKPPSVREMERRIELVGSKYPWLVCEEGGRLIGYSYAFRHHERAAYCWSLDFTVYVDAAFQGRDVGKELYESLIRLTKGLGYHNAFAGIAMPNDRSVRLHQNVGFTRVGLYRNAGYKLGRWHDVSLWQLELKPCVGEPGKPKSIREIDGERGQI